jgi:hypothetical protein
VDPDGLDTLTARYSLAIDIFQLALHYTESFEIEHVGADLAYTMGAILTGEKVEWSFKEPRAFLEVLLTYLPDTHIIWETIVSLEDDAGDTETTPPSLYEIQLEHLLRAG